MNQILAWARRNLFYIIYYAVAIPLLIVCLNWNDTRWRNLDWQIARLVTLLLLMVVPAGYQIWKKKASILSVALWALVMLFNIGMLARRDFVKYKNNICQDKFGPEFNVRRQRMGIPTIPPGWQNNARYGEDDAFWSGKEGVNGHEGKTIVFSSDCVLDFERDDYRIEPSNGLSRSISIIVRYAKGKGRDTISFQYSPGARTITRQQADSIFAAEKIQKDY